MNTYLQIYECGEAVGGIHLGSHALHFVGGYVIDGTYYALDVAVQPIVRKGFAKGQGMAFRGIGRYAHLAAQLFFGRCKLCCSVGKNRVLEMYGIKKEDS